MNPSGRTNPSDSQRRRVVFKGRVQGVGFRYTTCQIAQGYAVKGFVRNLSDGSVELVAEGRSQDLSAFLEEVKRVMTDYISDHKATTLPATGEFSSFVIAR